MVPLTTPGLVTMGFGGSVGPLSLFHYGGFDVTVTVGNLFPLNLPRLIGNEIPSAWTGVPITNFLRTTLLNFVATSTDFQELGFAVMNLARQTEVFNLVNNLDIDLYTPYIFSAAIDKLIDVDSRLAPLYNQLSSALSELGTLGAKHVHRQVIINALNSDSPLYRVSGVCTLIVFAGIFLLHGTA